MVGKNTVLFDTPPGMFNSAGKVPTYNSARVRAPGDRVNMDIYKLTRRDRINKSYELILKMGLHWCESYNDPAMSSVLSSA